MTYQEWAARWPQAASELMAMVAPPVPADEMPRGADEAYAQNVIRLEASQVGARLFRNNVGAARTDSGTHIRFGLANDSTAVNKTLKSADLIGIRPVRIEQRHVGGIIGQFLSREVKRPGWKFKGTDREVAQLNWANLIISFGGDAAMVSGRGSF